MDTYINFADLDLPNQVWDGKFGGINMYFCNLKAYEYLAIFWIYLEPYKVVIIILKIAANFYKWNKILICKRAKHIRVLILKRTTNT